MTNRLHMLIVDTISEECALRAILCNDSNEDAASETSADGTSLGLEYRERRIPLALSESCFSSVLAVFTISTSGRIKRKTRLLEGCFLKNVSTRSSTRFLK